VSALFLPGQAQLLDGRVQRVSHASSRDQFSALWQWSVCHSSLLAIYCLGFWHTYWLHRVDVGLARLPICWSSLVRCNPLPHCFWEPLVWSSMIFPLLNFLSLGLYLAVFCFCLLVCLFLQFYGLNLGHARQALYQSYIPSHGIFERES
jgi:hypothetical protein